MRICSMPLHLRRLLLGTTALTALAATAGTAAAGQPGLPTGGVVTAGTANIGPAAGNHLTVTTGGARTVIDWQSFSIASGNQVAIQQPGMSSITVNEVVGANPSQIFGDLSSNGRVVLANPNGIWFGPDAHVDVAGLVASTATLSQAALKSFAAGGRLSLDTPGSATASIVNDGRITIANQGLAALVAPGVRNSGIIEATLGTVTLASGTTSTLDFYGDGLINLAVTGSVTALAKGPDGKPMKAAVENTGTLAANGGHVLVTADVVKGVVDNVINMSGVTEARGVTVSGGDIVLDGGNGGVTVAGTLDVTGGKAGQAGGTVQVTGGAVTVASTAKVDASGAKGGGTVQIGGGPHGGGSLHHAQTVLVQGGASIKADATQNGDGGTVSLWSDQATSFAGAISAEGAGAGNGGWVETSGHWLSIAGGRVDTSAPGGRFGSWLLDPTAVDIVHGAADTASTASTFTNVSTINDGQINFALASNNVIVQTSGGNSGDITVENTANISWATGANLRLDATANAGNININGPISGASGSLTLASIGTVTQSAPIQVAGLELLGTGGAFNLTSPGNNVVTLAADTGSVAFDNGRNPLAIGTAGSTTGLTLSGNLALSGLSGILGLNGDVTVGGTLGVNLTAAATGATGMVLGTDVTIAATGANSPIQLGPIDGDTPGSRSLTVSATGTVGLDGVIGGTAPLFILNVTGSAIRVGSITTLCDQNYFGPVLVAGTSTITSSLGNINFTGKLDGVSGSEDLTINAPGASNSITFGGAVGSGNGLGTLNASAGAITVNAPITTTGAGPSSLTALNGSLLIDHDVSTVGSFTAAVGPSSSFNLALGTTISSSAGRVVIDEASLFDVATITIDGTISGKGVTIAAAGPNAGAGGTINIDSTAVIANTETSATNGPNSADLVFYSGPGSSGSISFSQGASVTARAGNIAFITDNFDLVLNTASGSSTVATPGIVIYTPASTLGTFTGPGFTMDNIPDGVPPGFGATVDIGSGGSVLSQSALDLLSGHGPSGNTVGALQLGLPGTANTVSTTGTASFWLPTAIYGADIDVNGAVTASSNLTLSATGSIIATSAPISVTGLFSASFGNGASFSLDSSSSITAGTGVIVAPAIGSGASVGTIDIAGGITAPEILLMSSDHLHDGTNGLIVLESGASITNTLTALSPGLNTTPTRADTIFYAGPNGTISIAGGVRINGGAGNVAFVADTVNLPDGGTPSTISSTGRVIVSPGSTDGELFAGTSVPDPFTTGGVINSNALLGLAVPGGGAPTGIAVGTSVSGSFTVSQALIDLMSGTGGTGASPVERLQIGLAGNSAQMTLGGPINFPAEVSFDGTNITVGSDAVLTNSGSQSSFDGGVLQPSGIIFTLTEARGVASSLTFDQGSSITSAGVVQADSLCLAGACAVAPVTTFAGTINAQEIAFVSAASQDFGIAGDTVHVLSSSVMNASGLPDPTNERAASGIVFQTGRGGSLTIDAGATLNAGRGQLDLFTDALGIGATAVLTAASIDLDTGTAGNWAFPAVAGPNGPHIQEEPTITLGGTSALGLSLSSATLAAFATAAGTIPVTIGDDRAVPAPVLVVEAGNATLPANTTIAADAFVQDPGTILSGGALTIIARTPTNIPSASDASSSSEFPPPTLPAPTITLGGTIDTSGGPLDLMAPVLITGSGASIDTRIAGSNGTGGNVVFAGSIDGPGGLTVNAGTAAVSEGGPVGAASPLSGVTINAGTIALAGATTTTGAQSYSGAVTLADGPTIILSSAGSVRFAGTVEGSSLSVTAGTIALDNVETSGAQSYTGTTTLDGTAYSAGSFAVSGPTVLANSGTITSTGIGGITFGGTLDGAFGLTLNAASGTVIAGPIGSHTALGNLAINAKTIAVGFATTSGAQSLTGVTDLGGTYTAGGSFTVTGPSVLTAATAISSAGGIALGTVDGPFGLTLNAGPAAVTLQGATLAGLTASAGTIALGSVATTGAQSYTGTTDLGGLYTAGGFTTTGRTLLTGATTIDAGAGGITFGGPVDGPFALALNAGSAAVALKGAAGAQAALASLTANAGTISLGSVATTGAQSYTGTTTFNGTYRGASFTANGADLLSGATGVVASAGNIGFGGTLDGAQNLVLTDTNGTVSFGGAVGGRTALAGLTVTANGIVAGSISTRGAQSYTGAMRFGGTYQANGFTTAGPLVLIGDSTINGGDGDITFGGTINGQQKLALISSDANVFFGGTAGSATARLTLLSIAGADNVTVLNNSSLFVDDFTATNIAGTMSFGDHSLESDDVVTIQATSVDGRVISTDASITANTVTGIIQGNTVSVNATGAVNEQVTAGDANISGASFTGSVQATRSASIGTTGDIAGNVSVTGGSATLSGANISGSVTSSGLAQISASQNVSADITGGGGVNVAASAGTVNGAITSTGGTSINVVATNVASTIIAQSNGSVDVTASNSITGSVTGGRVELTAPLINEQITAASAVIDSADANVTGSIGGVDAVLALSGSATDVTQAVLGATQQVASNADAPTVPSGDEDEEKKKKKKARTNDAVYDFANQYIDSLISGKPGH